MLDALPMTLHLDPMEPQKRAEIERERALTRLEQQRRAEAKGSRGSTCSRGLPLPPHAAQANSKQTASKQQASSKQASKRGGDLCNRIPPVKLRGLHRALGCQCKRWTRTSPQV